MVKLVHFHEKITRFLATSVAEILVKSYYFEQDVLLEVNQQRLLQIILVNILSKYLKTNLKYFTFFRNYLARFLNF